MPVLRPPAGSSELAQLGRPAGGTWPARPPVDGRLFPLAEQGLGHVQSRLHVVPAGRGGGRSSALLSRRTCERADLALSPGPEPPQRAGLGAPGGTSKAGVRVQASAGAPAQGPGGKRSHGGGATRREREPPAPRWMPAPPGVQEREGWRGRRGPHRTWCVNAVYTRAHQLCARDRH